MISTDIFEFRKLLCVGTILTILVYTPDSLAESTARTGDPSCSTPKSSPAPTIDWQNKHVLWLGTSIPQQGIRTHDSYPELFCEIMGCSVINNSLAGSHMKWIEQQEDESCQKKRNAPKGLTATNRELQAKQVAVLPDDGRDSYDASCNPAVNPLHTGYEYRINRAWDQVDFDIVVIDHGHNDRPVGLKDIPASFGSFTPTAFPVTRVVKGVRTALQVMDASHFARFDDITIRIPGIPKMDFWTGEIVSIEGDRVFVDLDSSRFDGELVGAGSMAKLDKSKLYDAYNLIISDIFHMASLRNRKDVLVILVTPPTEWTGGRNDGSIANINRALCSLAQQWQLTYVNLNDLMAIGKNSLYEHLEDGKHPRTRASRLRIAKAIADWARHGN